MGGASPPPLFGVTGSGANSFGPRRTAIQHPNPPDVASQTLFQPYGLCSHLWNPPLGPLPLKHILGGGLSTSTASGAWYQSASPQ